MNTPRDLRVAVRLPVSVGRKMAALCMDVSMQGFCLEVMKPVTQGSALDGYVLHGNRELEWRGEVMWVQPPNPMTNHWTRVGVKFTWLSPGLRALLSIEQKRRPSRP